MVVDEIVQFFMKELERVQDPSLAPDMQKYMKDIQPYLGIPAPKRKTIFSQFKKHYGTYCRKEMTNEEYLDISKQLWNGGYREHRYVTIFFMEYVKRFILLKNLKFIQDIIIEGGWWDTTDNLSNLVGIILYDNPQTMFSKMREWSKHENLWVRRTAILCQLKSKENTDTKLLTRIIENLIHEDEFFIQKAIGWSLREYSKSNRDWVADFIVTHPDLSKLAIREGSKYL